MSFMWACNDLATPSTMCLLRAGIGSSTTANCNRNVHILFAYNSFNVVIRMFSSSADLGEDQVNTMGDDSEWMELSTDQKCEHKVQIHICLKFTSYIFLCSYSLKTPEVKDVCLQ